MHWEAAFALNDRLPLVVNNLAWLLAYKEPTNPKRALELIDHALSTELNKTLLPVYHGTRGQILNKLDRSKEAVKELEMALGARINTPGIHDGLAVAYDKLGMPDMAAEHRKAATAKTASPKPQ